MLKIVRMFNYSSNTSFNVVEKWYFNQYVILSSKLPYLAKYVGYRILTLPKNDLFPIPEFQRMEEMWWPNKESYLIAKESDYNKQRSILNQSNPNNGSWLTEVKELFLTDEINILHPEMTKFSYATMNALDGRPHVKSIWPLKYLKGESVADRDEWYLNHHTRVAANNFNLLKYVTYRTNKELGKDYGVIRLSELCWKNWEMMLNDFNSSNGIKVKKDNEDKNGNWRVITQTQFVSYPFVVGNETIFI